MPVWKAELPVKVLGGRAKHIFQPTNQPTCTNTNTRAEHINQCKHALQQNTGSNAHNNT